MGIRQRLGRKSIEQDATILQTLMQQMIWLSAPLTHTSFDGDSFSDVGATKIENTSWSSTIPADAKGLYIQIIAIDSADPLEPDLYFAVGPTSTYWYALAARPLGKDYDMESCGWIPCTNGDIYYSVNASGANTMDVWLRCWGYCV